MSHSIWPHLLKNISLPHNRCTRLLPLTPCIFRPRTPSTALQLGRSSPRCRCSWLNLCSSQASGNSLDSPCTRLLLSTACTFRPRTPSTGLHPAPNSPHHKCRLSSLQASWSLPNNLGMLMTLRPRRLLNTCLRHMRCMRRLPLTPCTFLLRTLCSCLRQAPSSPHCKCRLSSLQASWSLPNNLGMLMTLRLQRLLKTCLGNIASIRLVPLSSCTFLPRTLCSCLRQAPSSPHCKCRLSSLQASWSLPNNLGMLMTLRPRRLLNTCLQHMRCMRRLPLTPCTFLPRTPRKPLQSS